MFFSGKEKSAESAWWKNVIFSEKQSYAIACIHFSRCKINKKNLFSKILEQKILFTSIFFVEEQENLSLFKFSKHLIS